MSENNPVEMSDSQWEDSIREAQIDVPRNYTTRKYRNFMFDLKATIIARMANSGGAFDLHDDVTTEETTPQDNDRLAVSAEDETGDPMRWLSLSRLATYVKGKIGNATTAIAGLMSAADKTKLDAVALEVVVDLGDYTRIAQQTPDPAAGEYEIVSGEIGVTPVAGKESEFAKRWHVGLEINIGNDATIRLKQQGQLHPRTLHGTVYVSNFDVVSGTVPAVGQSDEFLVPGDLTHDSELATVAKTGDYSDLHSQPNLADYVLLKELVPGSHDLYTSYVSLGGILTAGYNVGSWSMASNTSGAPQASDAQAQNAIAAGANTIVFGQLRSDSDPNHFVAGPALDAADYPSGTTRFLSVPESPGNYMRVVWTADSTLVGAGNAAYLYAPVTVTLYGTIPAPDDDEADYWQWAQELPPVITLDIPVSSISNPNWILTDGSNITVDWLGKFAPAGSQHRLLRVALNALVAGGFLRYITGADSAVVGTKPADYNNLLTGLTNALAGYADFISAMDSALLPEPVDIIQTGWTWKGLYDTDNPPVVNGDNQIGEVNQDQIWMQPSAANLPDIQRYGKPDHTFVIYKDADNYIEYTQTSNALSVSGSRRYFEFNREITGAIAVGDTVELHLEGPAWPRKNVSRQFSSPPSRFRTPTEAAIEEWLSNHGLFEFVRSWYEGFTAAATDTPNTAISTHGVPNDDTSLTATPTAASPLILKASGWTGKPTDWQYGWHVYLESTQALYAIGVTSGDTQLAKKRVGNVWTDIPAAELSAHWTNALDGAVHIIRDSGNIYWIDRASKTNDRDVFRFRPRWIGAAERITWQVNRYTGEDYADLNGLPVVKSVSDTTARTIASGSGWRTVSGIAIDDFPHKDKVRVSGQLAAASTGDNVRVLAKMQYRIGTGSWTDLRMLGITPEQYNYMDYFVSTMPFDFEWEPGGTEAIDLRFQVQAWNNGAIANNVIYINRPGSGSGPQTPDYTTYLRVEEVID